MMCTSDNNAMAASVIIGFSGVGWCINSLRWYRQVLENNIEDFVLDPTQLRASLQCVT